MFTTIGLVVAFAGGLVLKTLVPMPWADDPVRAGWAWAWGKITGKRP